MTGQPSPARSRDVQGMRGTLAALAAQLGQTPAEVAGILHAELARAVAEIDSGLDAGDAEEVGRASHAARNSALMLDDQAMLTALRALDAACTRGDARARTAARAVLQARWDGLAEVLRGV